MIARRTCVWALFLATAVLPGARSAIEASDWLRFRGPNGTGISDDPGVPVEIGEERNRLWKVKLPGSGNSSPVIAGERIFLQAASDDGMERSIVCVGLKDGKILWQQKAAGHPAKTHQKNTLASCTAAIGEDRVFMPFWDGADLSLACYDFDGNSLWTTPLGPFASQHGAGHSPIVIGNKVVLAIDQDGAAEVVALDVEDGQVAWRTRRPPFRSSYSTPLLHELAGEAPEIVVASTAGIAGYDPQSGSENWKWEWASNNKSLRTVGSPIISQGIVFFTGGNGPGDRHAVAVRLDSKPGGQTEGHLAWETRKIFPYVPSLLAHGDHLYFVNDAGIAGCYVARTGAKVWEKRLDIGIVTASPLLIDGRIYAVGETGGVHVFAAETRYRKLSSDTLGEGVYATPAVADGRLVIRGREHLYCFGK